MKILVGIAGSSSGWTSIARSEGFPFVEIHEAEQLRECSAVIAGDGMSPGLDEALREYGTSGGAVLCSPAVYARLSRTTMRSRHVRYLYPEEGSQLARAGFIDIERKCSIVPGAEVMRTDAGDPAVYAPEFGGGHIVVLPFDAGEVIADLRTRRRSFPASARKLPHETVSTVTRAGVQRLVAVALEWLHHRRNLPYVHLWYYPEGARSIFGLRIDTDDGVRGQIGDLHALARRMDLPMSWFVHVKAQAPFLEEFSRMPGHEIGVHCYEHRRYDEPEAARSDLRKALDALAAAGLNPRSFAAPYGTWSPELDRVIEDFGFEYSSEFSYDYDGFPSHPVVGGALRPTLQVPVHPISIGSLRRQGFTPAAMRDYFDGVVRRKLALHEPLLFYHHPRDGNLEVLADLVTRVRQEHVLCMTMGDVARWWKRRDALAVQVEGDTLTASPEGEEVRISMPDGRREVVLPAGRTDLRTIAWQERARASVVDRETFRARTLNPWMAVNAIEDRITRLFR